MKNSVFYIPLAILCAAMGPITANAQRTKKFCSDSSEQCLEILLKAAIKQEISVQDREEICNSGDAWQACNAALSGYPASVEDLNSRISLLKKMCAANLGSSCADWVAIDFGDQIVRGLPALEQSCSAGNGRSCKYLADNATTFAYSEDRKLDLANQAYRLLVEECAIGPEYTGSVSCSDAAHALNHLIADPNQAPRYKKEVERLGDVCHANGGRACASIAYSLMFSPYAPANSLAYKILSSFCNQPISKRKKYISGPCHSAYGMAEIAHKTKDAKMLKLKMCAEEPKSFECRPPESSQQMNKEIMDMAAD
jgi:hypothetical protein